MKDKKVYKKVSVGDSSVEMWTPDYEGITKVINAFVEIYKHCGEKRVIDDVLKRTLENRYMVIPHTNIEMKLNKDVLDDLKNNTEK